eukprot:TRINITY_DN11611_c0_g3_i1.p1 TRINITY_DN11611_c0_g3~~TRINITY_DN11611_c0_g3_i1.p1  ORF type:complete len:281 (+),score=98.53 TRINITY_DN11611_c0_g3_i1:47-889(+)
MAAAECVVRTLSGAEQPLVLTRGADSTVEELRDLISEAHEYAAAGLRLVWDGAVLTDGTRRLRDVGWAADQAAQRPFVAVGRPRQLQYNPSADGAAPLMPPLPAAPHGHTDPVPPPLPQWVDVNKAAPPPVADDSLSESDAFASTDDSEATEAEAPPDAPPPPAAPPATADGKVATLHRLGYDRNLCRYVVAARPDALLSELLQDLKSLQEGAQSPPSAPQNAPPEAAPSRPSRPPEEEMVITSLMALGILGVSEEAALAAYYEHGRDVQSAANALLGIA